MPDARPRPPVSEHHHRDVQGGVARAAVFGASDGLVSNVSLILGVAGADPGAGVVRLAGLAGLIAGAVSMAAGEYGSMKAQQELLERELALERRELARNPHVETVELSQLYQSRGVEPELARQLAEGVMTDPETALRAHAREELGIDPDALGSPVRAAGSSFVSFSLGALLPLLPWFVTSGTAAIVASVVLAVAGAAGLGVALARFTLGSPFRLALRYVVIAVLAGAVTYGIGSVVGVST
ncbi:MAG TPA: VIT1/CCC1 transporter family protein [Acidimicrobiales bacterium]